TTTDNPPAYIHAKELVSGSIAIEEGWTLQTSGLKITALQTSGHSVAGLTYVIDGMNTPIAVVGDAMFAGSMGGGMVSFSEALKNNREKILTLSDQTVLCPGHGPLTTVGQEKVHNPFFPEFK
ncbi:MAG: MBL fold metallo-hydrolase, partial [Opitutae bacterium]